MTPEADLLWRTAQALNAEAARVSPEAGRLPPLLFFTDGERTPEPWRTAERLPAGAGVVYRHFGAPDRRETAERLAAVCRRGGLTLLIGADAALAEAVGGDGVHLPERSLGQAVLLRAAQPRWIITGAAHDDADPAPGTSARVLSPVFPAGGTSAHRAPLSVQGFAALQQRLAASCYALGGVSVNTVDQLIGSGACGIAGVGAIERAFGRD